MKFGVDYRWLAPFHGSLLLPAIRGIHWIGRVAWRSSFGNRVGREFVLPRQADALLTAKNLSLFGQDTWKSRRDSR